MQIDQKYFKKIIKSVGDSTVNKLCKQIEVLEDAKILSSKDAFILKSNLKNTTHEAFREVKNHIICWQQGFKFNNLKVYNPPKNTDK